MRRFLIAFVLAAGVATASPAIAAQYWFGGQDPVARQGQHFELVPDWMEMFAPGSAWQRGQSHLSVFKVSAQFVLHGSDDMIRTVVNGLHHRHIAFAVEMSAVMHTPECGVGEGYAPPGLIERVAGRLQSLGLALDDWAMDEPLWFGHERTWVQNACAYSIEVVAERVARNVAVMRRYFPAAEIGDIEVLRTDRMPTRQLIGDYVAFAQAFQQLTGRKLAFFHVDVAWRNGGEQIIPPLWRQMRGLGIRTGIIIGGSPEDPTDESWVADGLQRLQMLVADPATRPDDVIVQSWQAMPRHMLPETQPGSSTFELKEAEDLAR